jgi:ribosome biogenesis GTPase / thiamine phosphate phosphatase
MTAHASASDRTEVGRVLRAQSGFYFVATDDGVVTAVMRGRMKKDRRDTGLVALGDLVRFERVVVQQGRDEQVGAVIVEILPRRTVLARPAPGPRGAWLQDVIVANVDQLVDVFAVRDPAPRLRMLDRFLALAEIDEIDSVIVFNKSDLGLPDDLRAAAERYAALAYPVIVASAATGEGIDALRAVLAGRVSAVVGPSGVGKSSLLNAVDPTLRLRVGQVSESVGKGRHTTRVAELYAVADGGLVADTPGLRELGVWQADAGLLEFAFVEFRPYLGSCRYYDCTHVHEPGCAVRAALASGDVSPERYDSYVKILAGEEP